MTRLVGIAGVFGVVLFVVGGLKNDPSFLYAGSLVLGLALLALLAAAIWRSPAEVVRAEANAEAIAAGFPEDRLQSPEGQKANEQANGADLVPSSTMSHTDARPITALNQPPSVARADDRERQIP